MDNKSRQTVFFGVIAIATLIIAMIGATLAFFSATSTGTENGVSATSDVININYTDSTVITANNLIPSSKSVAVKGYKKTEDQCIDDNDREVCSVYSFSVENKGTSAKNISGKLTIGLNEFTNLKYMVYEDGETDPIVDSTGFDTKATEVSLFGTELTSTVEIAGGATKKYNVVVYLEESGTANDSEQGKKFNATASISVDGGGQITGEIADK